MIKILQHTLLLSGLSLAFLACDNNDSKLGVDIQPEDTKLKSYAETFEIQAETVPFDILNKNSDDEYHNIFVASPYTYLGKLPDKFFHPITCDYLCQLYVPKHFQFAETPLNGKIDSTRVEVYYNSFEGDSISPLSIAAYKLGKTIPSDSYSVSSIDPYKPLTLLGKTSFLPKYGSFSYISQNGSKTTVASIPVDKHIGQEIFEKSKANDPIFSSLEEFQKFFPGLYIKPQAGSGAILEVFRTSLSMYYQVETTLKDSKGEDSVGIVTHKQELIYTPEVNLLSRFKNEGLKHLLGKSTQAQNSVSYSYIKSPAGVLTEITLPTQRIASLLSNAKQGWTRHLVSVPFTLLAEPSRNDIYNLPTPSNLLLIPKDSVASFFEKQQTELSHPYTTFLSQAYSKASTSYSFSNIVSLIQKHIDKNPKEDLKLWVIPVDRSEQKMPNGAVVTSGLSNLLKPSGLKIKYTDKSKNFRVIYTERKLKNN